MNKPKIEINFIQKHLLIPPSKCDRIARRIYDLQRNFNVKIRFTNNQTSNLTITGAPNKVAAVHQRINNYLVDLPSRDGTSFSSYSVAFGYPSLFPRNSSPIKCGGPHSASYGLRQEISNDLPSESTSSTLVTVLNENTSDAQNPKLFECSICFENYNMEEKCIKCSKHSEVVGVSDDIDEEGHTICIECIKRYAHSSITENSVAFGGIGLKCVEFECKNTFLLSSFESFIENIDYIPLMERLQQQCIIDANLEDLVTCHECGYKVCVPKNNQYYICECGKKNCRKCPRLFDHKHFGKTCQQMDQEEANNVILRNLESKISEVVIRKCQKCGISFVKNEGCNKMECRCGAKQCYICGKQDIEHSHFCCCGNVTEKHGPCSKCKRSCRSWENYEEIDETKIDTILSSFSNLPQNIRQELRQSHRPFSSHGLPEVTFQEAFGNRLLRRGENVEQIPEFNRYIPPPQLLLPLQPLPNYQHQFRQPYMNYLPSNICITTTPPFHPTPQMQQQQPSMNFQNYYPIFGYPSPLVPQQQQFMAQQNYFYQNNFVNPQILSNIRLQNYCQRFPPPPYPPPMQQNGSNNGIHPPFN